MLVGTSPQVQRTLRQICRPRDKSRHNVFVCNFPVWPRTRLIEFPDQRSPSSCQLPLPALQIVAGSRRVQSDAVHSILDDTFSDRRFRDAVIDDDAIAGIDVDRSARGHSERRMTSRSVPADATWYRSFRALLSSVDPAALGLCSAAGAARSPRTLPD